MSPRSEPQPLLLVSELHARTHAHPPAPRSLRAFGFNFLKQFEFFLLLLFYCGTSCPISPCSGRTHAPISIKSFKSSKVVSIKTQRTINNDSNSGLVSPFTSTPHLVLLLLLLLHAHARATRSSAMINHNRATSLHQRHPNHPPPLWTRDVEVRAERAPVWTRFLCAND